MSINPRFSISRVKLSLYTLWSTLILFNSVCILFYFNKLELLIFFYVYFAYKTFFFLRSIFFHFCNYSELLLRKNLVLYYLFRLRRITFLLLIFIFLLFLQLALVGIFVVHDPPVVTREWLKHDDYENRCSFHLHYIFLPISIV